MQTLAIAPHPTKLGKNFLAQEEVIRLGIDKFDKKKNELKIKRKEFKDVLESDQKYSKANDEVKTAQQKRKEEKMRLMNQPQISKLSEEIEDLKVDVDSLQLTLSDALLAFTEKTGITSIEDKNKEVREIKVFTQAKLL